MAVTIQIRNVPEALHRRLKERATRAGKSLSEYLLYEIERSLTRPIPEELLQRLRQHDRVEFSESAAQAVAAERENR